MKDCPPGKYFCNKEKKCMPIPKGHYVGARGWLRPDPEDENGRKSKKNGNKNGNGHSGTNGSSSGNGNGNGNGAAGGGVSEDKKWIQKATKNMRKDKPCTGEKFGSETCPPGSKRYNLAKTFRKMAKEEVVDEMKISKYKKSTAEKMIDAVKKAKKRHDKATEKKPKTAPYAVMAQEYKPEGEVIEDWKPEIEVIDTKKRKKDAEKKRKEAESSLPPHLKLDAMKKAFAHTNEEVELDEGGMARQVKHSKSRSTAVLTANRGDKSSKENKARNKELGKKIRSMGYGYKKVKGEYPEKDEKTGKKKTVSEPSMAVNAPKKKFKKFKKQMKRLGKEYNQDAVITKKGKDKATLHPTHKRARKTSTGVSGKGSKLGQVRPGRTGKYGHTKVGSKTYTYEATTLPRINGQTMYVTFQWRGKYMSIQMFFPELKVPSKKEVQDAVVKVYPGSRVMNYDVVLRDPTKPILQLPEDTAPLPGGGSNVPGVDDVQAKQLQQQKKGREDQDLKSKEKRVMRLKRQVLLKKLMAVRAGAGADIVT